MNFRSESERYSRASVVMHWITVLCFVGIYASILLTEEFEEGSLAGTLLFNTHTSLGLLVCGLVWIRFFLLFKGSRPPIVPAPPAWQEKLGKAVHGCLYLMIIFMPLVGWALLGTWGEPTRFFGMELPALLSADRPLSKWLKQIHELGGNTGYFLIGLHAAAGLFHHYVVKDNTLRRMWLR